MMGRPTEPLTGNLEQRAGRRAVERVGSTSIVPWESFSVRVARWGELLIARLLKNQADFS